MEYQSAVLGAILDRRWRWGLPSPVWLRELARITELVKKMGLKPVPEKALPRFEVAIEGRIPPFPGGLRTPHLHLNGQVFTLNEEQWQQFAGGIITDALKTRLAAVKAVSFEQAMEMSDVIEVLP